jgi:Flp pilus assembly protein TadD
LKDDWQRHLTAATGYLEFGMFDDAATALEEIDPEDKTRTEVLGTRVGLYLAAEKWEMAAAVAARLVKVEPENAGWWINLAYATRRSDGIEKAREILLRASKLHHDNAAIEFNLACYASVAGCFEEAKARLQRAIEIDRELRAVALDDEDLRPLWDHLGGSRY